MQYTLLLISWTDQWMCKSIWSIDIPHSFKLILYRKKNIVGMIIALHKPIERIMSANWYGSAMQTFARCYCRMIEFHCEHKHTPKVRTSHHRNAMWFMEHTHTHTISGYAQWIRMSSDFNIKIWLIYFFAFDFAIIYSFADPSSLCRSNIGKTKVDQW